MDSLALSTRKKRKGIEDGDDSLLTPKKARIRYALSRISLRNIAKGSIEATQRRVQFEQSPQPPQP
jgi:hypothetical protein